MFEYKIVSIDGSKSAEDVEKELNKFGAEGWELMAMEPISKAGFEQVIFQASTTSGFVAIFKRRKGGN